jgi:hypothetical protein
MANTFELIASTTLASAASNIEFASIPATFTDLKLVYSLRSDNGDDYFALTLNGSSSSFTTRDIQGNGSSASSANRTDNLLVYTQDPSSMTANTFSSGDIYFPNYAGSTYKSFSQDTAYENNGTGAGMALRAGLWSNTAAITTIRIAKASGNFVQYSTAYLYGVKNA